MRTVKILLNNVKLRYKPPQIIALLIVSVLFVLTQILAVFKFPVEREDDIAFLEAQGERQYLYGETAQEERQMLAAAYLRDIVARENVDAKKLNPVIDLIEKAGLANAMEQYKNNDYVSPWLHMAFNSAKQKLLSPAEINENILLQTSGYGYQQDFQNRYITYSSAVLGFLLIALAYSFIKVDDHIHSRDLYSHLLGSRTRYFRLQFLTVTLPILLFFYLIGFGINLLSFLRFHHAGLPIIYLPFAIKFITFFVPNIMIFASVSAAIMIALEKSSQLVPVYLLWCVMNITPRASRISGVLEKLFFFKRLDFTNIRITGKVIAEQITGLAVSILIFETALWLRKKKED